MLRASNWAVAVADVQLEADLMQLPMSGENPMSLPPAVSVTKSVPGRIFAAWVCTDAAVAPPQARNCISSAGNVGATSIGYESAPWPHASSVPPSSAPPTPAPAENESPSAA